jgi:hypothetical protein
MDVYQVLMQDHRIVEELFSEIEKSDDREVERRELQRARPPRCWSTIGDNECPVSRVQRARARALLADVG